MEETAQHHLILGGGGFLGRHVALLLALSGDRVTIAGRTVSDIVFPPEMSGHVLSKPLDLALADWDRLLADVDVVHHYAWSSIPATANADPSADLLGNVGMTLRLLDALKRRGHGRLIFASSGGTVYGPLHCVPVTEDHPLAPVTAYGASKATAELYLKLYRSLHCIDCRVARIANPYGAGQRAGRDLGAVTTFVRHALSGQKIEIWGNGEVVRDYIHVSDVASCLVKLSRAPATSDDFVFNIGSGIGISLNDIISELETCLGRNLLVDRSAPRSFDVSVSILAIDRVRRALGWAPRLSFSAGLALTLSDLKSGQPFSTVVVEARN